MHQGAQEHQNGTCATRSTLVDGLRSELLGTNHFKVLTAVGGCDGHADGLEDITDTVHLLDTGDPAQHRASMVEH